MTEPSAPAPVKVSLADQIVEVEKTVRDRARQYPGLVERGRLLQPTADHKLGALRAVQSTLVWLEQNEHWIRPEFERRREEASATAEAEALRAEIEQHPAVKTVLGAFPGAEVRLPRDPAPDLFPPEPPPFDLPQHEEPADAA